MPGQLVTRRTLARDLVVNAGTKPLNVAVPAAVAVFGFVLGTPLLFVVAVLVYVAMLAATFFDTKEARRVGERSYARAGLRPKARAIEETELSPAIAARLEEARDAEARIRDAAVEAPLSLTSVLGEVGGLMDELAKLARRAQHIHTYLAHQNEADVRARLARLKNRAAEDPEVATANAQAAAALQEQLAVTEALRGHLSRFDAQMEHIVGSLGTIHGQIVRLSVTEEAGSQADVASRVRDLRGEVSAAAEALGEVYGETRELNR